MGCKCAGNKRVVAEVAIGMSGDRVIGDTSRISRLMMNRQRIVRIRPRTPPASYQTQGKLVTLVLVVWSTHCIALSSGLPPVPFVPFISILPREWPL